MELLCEHFSDGLKVIIVFSNYCFFSFFVKVNGKDVSNLAHEEAVNEFLKAPEPILVEVKRRTSNAIDSALNVPTPLDDTAAHDHEKHFQSIGVQTEHRFNNSEFLFNDVSPMSDDQPCNEFQLNPSIDIEV